MRSAAFRLSSAVTWVYRWVWLSWEWPRICGAHAGFREERVPVRPVVPGVDGGSGHGAEDQVPVAPGAPGHQAVGFLLEAPSRSTATQAPPAWTLPVPPP